MGDSLAPNDRGTLQKALVRDLMSHPAATCQAGTSLAEVAQRMRRHRVGSVIVLDAESRPIGIVTERDIVYKVLAGDEPPASRSDLSAGDVMSSPLLTVRPDDSLDDALYLMMKNGCRRMVVVGPAGHLAGLLSMRDLLRVEGYEAQALLGSIRKAATLQVLSALRPRIDDFVHRLFLHDVDARSLAEILTGLNDAIVQRVLSLSMRALKQSGEAVPPLSYAWVCFGSEGRREQVLRGDQDNGLILADEGVSPQARQLFRRLAQEATAQLAEYGFALCQGGVMAREEAYFGTLAEWRDRVSIMVRGVSEGKVLRDLSIVLDLRHVAGDRRLTQGLWDHLAGAVQGHPPALRALADDAVSKHHPHDLFGRFLWDRDAQGKRALNVKRWAALPLVATVKALALEEGIQLTATAERIEALRAAGALDPPLATRLLSAHNLFLRLKLQSSLEEVMHGRRLGPFVHPQEWTDRERQDLKHALRAVADAQEILKTRFVL